MVQLTKLCQVIVLAVILFISVTSAGRMFRVCIKSLSSFFRWFHFYLRIFIILFYFYFHFCIFQFSNFPISLTLFIFFPHERNVSGKVGLVAEGILDVLNFVPQRSGTIFSFYSRNKTWFTWKLTFVGLAPGRIWLFTLNSRRLITGIYNPNF